MLSYRHGYHAGNFADVVKHLVQIEVLNYLAKKTKPFDYIDTHAGAGCYRLDSGFALKKAEYQNGIARLWPDATTDFPELADYLALVHELNPDQLNRYPGSAEIAARLLRPQDNAWLHELHSDDFAHLQRQYSHDKRFKLRQQDGFQALNALLPTQSRRAFVLIDPPYEQKADYRRIIDSVCAGHRRMPQTVFVIWYPVVERARVRDIQRHFEQSGLRNIAQYELGIAPDNSDYGMTSAGVIVINPPWTLSTTMQQLLPRLAERLSSDGEAHYQCRQWVAE